MILEEKWIRESAVFAAGSTYFCEKRILRNKKQVMREDCVCSVNTALSNYGLDFKMNVGQVKRWLESATCTKSTEVVSAQD